MVQYSAFFSGLCSQWCRVHHGANASPVPPHTPRTRNFHVHLGWRKCHCGNLRWSRATRAWVTICLTIISEVAALLELSVLCFAIIPGRAFSCLFYFGSPVMMNRHVHYTAAFKKWMILLAKERGNSSAARCLGLCESTVRGWRKWRDYLLSRADS